MELERKEYGNSLKQKEDEKILNRRQFLKVISSAICMSLAYTSSFATETIEETDVRKTLLFIKNFLVSSKQLDVSVENKANIEKFFQLIETEAKKVDIKYKTREDILVFIYKNGFFINTAIFYDTVKKFIFKIKGFELVNISEFKGIKELYGEVGGSFYIAIIDENIPTGSGRTEMGNRTFLNIAEAKLDLETFVNDIPKEWNRTISLKEYEELIKENEACHIVFASAFPNLMEQEDNLILTTDHLKLDNHRYPSVLEIDEFLSDASNIISNPLKIIMYMGNLAMIIQEKNGKIIIGNSDTTVPIENNYSYNFHFLISVINKIFEKKGLSLYSIIKEDIKNRPLMQNFVIQNGTTEEFWTSINTISNKILVALGEDGLSLLQEEYKKQGQLCIDILFQANDIYSKK